MVWANQIIVLFDTTHLELQYPIHFSNSYSSKFARAHSSFCTWHIFFCHHPQHPHSNNNANSQNVERFMMNWCYDSLVCGNNANASFKPSHISLFAIITFYHCYNYLTLTNIWWCRGGRMLLMLLSSNTNLFCILCCSAVPYFPFHCGAIYKLLFASFVAAPMCSSWFISSLSFPHLCCNGFFLSFEWIPYEMEKKQSRKFYLIEQIALKLFLLPYSFKKSEQFLFCCKRQYPR